MAVKQVLWPVVALTISYLTLSSNSGTIHVVNRLRNRLTHIIKNFSLLLAQDIEQFSINTIYEERSV